MTPTEDNPHLAVRVVDASVLVAALTDSSPVGVWAEEVLASGFLVAPQLILVEVLNILRRLERAGQLTESEADGARRDLMQLDIELYPLLPVADRVWRLRSNLTAYDAWYVALAESLEVPLATLDRSMARGHLGACDFDLPPR